MIGLTPQRYSHTTNKITIRISNHHSTTSDAWVPFQGPIKVQLKLVGRRKIPSSTFPWVRILCVQYQTLDIPIINHPNIPFIIRVLSSTTNFDIFMQKDLDFMENLNWIGFHPSEYPVITFFPNTPAKIREYKISQFNNQRILRRNFPTRKEQLDGSMRDPVHVH